MQVVAPRYWKAMVEDLWNSFEESGALKDALLEYFENEGLAEIVDLKVEQIELKETEKDEDGRRFTILADIEFEGKFKIYNEDLNSLLEENGLVPIEFTVILNIALTFEAVIYAVREDGSWVYEDYEDCGVEEVLSVEKVE